MSSMYPSPTFFFSFCVCVCVCVCVYLFVFLGCFLFLFCVRVSLCHPGWPQICNLPTLASQVMGLKVCITTTSLLPTFNNY
jgi:hypothetical protein